MTHLLAEGEGQQEQAIRQPPAVDVQGREGLPVLPGSNALVHRREQPGAQGRGVRRVLRRQGGEDSEAGRE